MKNKKSFTIIDMYKEYIKKHDKIEYNTYKYIVYCFYNVFLNTLFENSALIKLPYGLGCVCIVKYKPKTLTQKSLSVDYKASAEYGKKIYHLNEHSDGYKFRLYWSKLPQTFPDRYKYQLQLVRTNKRKLAQYIFNKHDYINIDDIQIYNM